MRARIIPIFAVFLVFFMLCINTGVSDETKTISASSEIKVFGSQDNYNNSNDLTEINYLKIYPDNKTGTPHRIFGKQTKIEGIESLKGIKEKGRKNFEKDIIRITDNFISKNKDFLGANPDDLKLKNFDSDNENYYINYRQYYMGIPVHRSFTGLTIDAEGRILLVGCDFHPGINVSTIPEIGKKELVEIVKKYEPGIEILNFSPVIFPEETYAGFDYHLAWKVVTASNRDKLIFFVDAHTGELIYNYSAVKNLNGTVTGMVYPEHPLQQQIEVKFPCEFIYVNATRNDSRVFYSWGFKFLRWLFLV